MTKLKYVFLILFCFLILKYNVKADSFPVCSYKGDTGDLIISFDTGLYGGTFNIFAVPKELVTYTADSTVEYYHEIATYNAPYVSFDLNSFNVDSAVNSRLSFEKEKYLDELVNEWKCPPRAKVDFVNEYVSFVPSSADGVLLKNEWDFTDYFFEVQTQKLAEVSGINTIDFMDDIYISSTLISANRNGTFLEDIKCDITENDVNSLTNWFDFTSYFTDKQSTYFLNAMSNNSKYISYKSKVDAYVTYCKNNLSNYGYTESQVAQYNDLFDKIVDTNESITEQIESASDLMAGYNDKTTIYSCDYILGDVEDKNSVAFYLQLALNLMRYAAPILLIVFGISDFIKALIADDKDALNKAVSKNIKRLVYVILLFVIPTLMMFLLKLFGISGNCSIR